MLKPHRYTFLLLVTCGDVASKSDSGGNSHVSMFVDSYILMGVEAFAGKLWSMARDFACKNSIRDRNWCGDLCF